LFLIIFSYTMLCKFNYYIEIEEIDNEYENLTNQTFLDNQTIVVVDKKISEKKIANPSFFEYIIIFWVSTLFLDEVYQVNLLF
jgi:hypothetical protein